MFDTAFKRLFNLEYPIIQGGMAWVAEGRLAAAVSNAGGLGLIAGGGAPADVVREEIRKCRALTGRAFGVNIMLMSPFAADLAQLVIDEGVPVITTGAGSPGAYMDAWKAAGAKVVPVVASSALAKRMERMGADAVVAEGCEAGGHIGELTTMALVPQVVDAVGIPVVAAGGIADGRGLAAAFMLGAQGVQCGTCFLAADECAIHENYKSMVIKAGDSDTTVTGRSHGHPVRSLKNKLTRKYAELEKAGAPFDELEALAAGGLRIAVQEGDVAGGSFMAGQSAGLVRRTAPARVIIEDMFSGAERLIKSVGGQ